MSTCDVLKALRLFARQSLELFETNASMLTAEVAAMAYRHFSGVAIGGRLYPEGTGNWGSWDRSRLVYWTEANVDGILKMRMVDRKADSPDQLTEMTRATVRPGPAVTIWIREGLEDVAQKLWEHPKAKD